MAKIDRTAITIINSINENPSALYFFFVFNNFNLTKNQLLNIRKILQRKKNFANI